MKGKLNSQGFGLIGTLLVILVIVALGFGGWYAYHRDHKTKIATTSGGNKIGSTSTQGNGSGSTGTTSTDPYAGWKTYCDTTYHYCFKYPADWILESTTLQTSALNASKSVEVDYYNPYVHDGGLQPVSTLSITNLNVAGLNVKVVGVVYTSANQPYYGVVDASKLNSYPLTVGQTADFPSPLSFTDSHATSPSIVNFSARATSPMSSLSAAQDWYNSADAKTSLLILESLTYQP